MVCELVVLTDAWNMALRRALDRLCEKPFQSDLSGQEFWTLLRTGHRPVGMVMGSACTTSDGAGR